MTVKTNIDAFYDQADRYVSEGRYDEAIELYLKLAEAHPEDESIIMSLAWAYRDSGKVADAIRCLEGLLEKELNRVTFTGFAFDELVRIYREEGCHDRLITICERAAAVQPDDLSIRTSLGDAYLEAGKPAEAAEIFSALVELEPDASALCCRLGDARIATEDYDKAEDAYDRAASIEPSEAHRFYSALANALFRRGEQKRAEMVLRKSLHHKPDQPLVFCSLGDILVSGGRIADAEAAYENAVRLDPASRGGYYNRLGNTLAGEGHHDRAVEAFKKAIATDPKNPFYYLNLVKACEALGWHEEARAAYEQARSLGVFS